MEVCVHVCVCMCVCVCVCVCVCACANTPSISCPHVSISPTHRAVGCIFGETINCSPSFPVGAELFVRLVEYV